jgi:hypothetical protein
MPSILKQEIVMSHVSCTQTQLTNKNSQINYNSLEKLEPQIIYEDKSRTIIIIIIIIFHGQFSSRLTKFIYKALNNTNNEKN